MNEPTPIGTVIDEALLSILGPAGADSYDVLCRQTAETRRQIEAEVNSEFGRYAAEAVGELASMVRNRARLAREARVRAAARVQSEIGRRISAEDQRFRKACQTLFARAEVQNRPGCDGCG